MPDFQKQNAAVRSAFKSISVHRGMGMRNQFELNRHPRASPQLSIRAAHLNWSCIASSPGVRAARDRAAF